ncbi:hypothetical protein [Streptomyces sp. bgisy027]|uniref:hypothetical protein n=1 Tax=Streptomyces sp. bgisy027 TaxID=3413770 RepID=UPI003D73E295
MTGRSVGDGQVGDGEELPGTAEADAEQMVLGAASGAPADGRAQFGGRHAVPDGVLGDRQRDGPDRVRGVMPCRTACSATGSGTARTGSGEAGTPVLRAV